MGAGENPMEQSANCRLEKTIFMHKYVFTGGTDMPRKATASKASDSKIIPMLKTVEQMSRISGIGENKLRELMDHHEIEYVQNGNRRLLADSAIWDWYNRNKCPATGGDS